MSLGESIARPDAWGKVTGETKYSGDRFPDGVLFAKVVFTDQPHARITRLDVSAAEATEGVHLVLTAADVAMNEYGLTMFDQPVLIGPNGTGASPVRSDVSCWEADHLALVVAETEEIATTAAALIEADWEQLPLVRDLDEALADDALLVHPENGLDSNAYYHLKVRKGDVEAAFENAHVVIEGTYELPRQEHAYLQPEAGLAYVDDEGRATVEIAGQWIHEDREQIAHALGVDDEAIRVIYPAIGGAFGGREDMSLQIVLALAVTRLAEKGIDRPVRSQWSREESMVGHHKRHRGRVHARLAADANGKILGVEADSYVDAGAYNYTSNKVLGNLHMSVAGSYEVPAARLDSHAVYTTSIPGGAFRGFGGPQGCFVAEMQMNRLAEALDMDPVELRRINSLREGSIGITSTPMPAGVSMPEVIEAAAAAADWDSPLADPVPVSSFASLPPAAGAAKRGRGFACGYKNVGFSFGFPERSNAKIILHGDGDRPDSAEIFLAGAEVGQGGHTAWVQMAAEALDLPFDAFTPVLSDTATTKDSGSASASRLSWMAGNAVIDAATAASKAWVDGDRPAVGDVKYSPPPTEMIPPDGGPATPNFAYGYMAEAVDLTVDTETGHITVHDVVCAVDVGRVINPQLVTGQIEGAIVQAHGYAISEKVVFEEGRLLTPRLSSYLIPGIGDCPESIRSVLVEHPDPLGPFGVRGMAEMPIIPYAPAVAAALHDATGVWFHSFPLTPSKVRAQLKA